MASQPEPARSLTGRTLGDFVVREPIGAGGFGTVYRAHQPLLDREAVIKVLHQREGAGAGDARRFLREVQLASRLDHPFAAHIYAFGAEPDGLRWIAMELVRGTPLDRLLEAAGPLPLERFVPLLERIGEVLHTAHEQGIVHRDIKPANVMVLARAGRLLPKLLDFGIAKLTEDDDARAAAAIGAPDADPPAAGAEALARTMAAAVTAQGAIVGSPFYMAPEQWVAAHDVGPRTDLYALGCLTYEALTGRPAFAGATVAAIASAHARAEVPPLGDRFPRELDLVLRKAMAKRPRDRYASALELAAAVRAAAGLADDREALPQLPDLLREEATAGAPQPIAEAVAAFEAAGNAYHARDALWQLLRVTARYLGIVALASRTRVGPAAGGDGPAILERLRALRQRGLTDEEWLDLARGLTRPFAGLRDAHPLPELVDLLWDDRGAERIGPLDRLLALRGQGLRSSSGASGEVHELLAAAVGELEQLLRSLAFLADYLLCVPRGDTAERWMGVAARHRALVPLSGPLLAARQPALVDHRGAPVLELAPLVQLRRPSRGAPEELFFLEGPGRSGAKLVALAGGFELHDAELWSWFGDHLLHADEAAGAGASEEQPPYRGLQAFSSADAALFFGREREADAVANRLRVQPLLVVVGPSGAGKSSFVRAALVPQLPEEGRLRRWETLSLRPGPAPLAGLAAALERAGVPLADSAAALRRDPEALGAALRAHAQQRGGAALLLVDQFEELLTLCGDAEERATFAAAVALAARAPEDPVRVVLTLRDDFLIRAQELPALRERLSSAVELLATPAAEDLLRILVEPARRAGYAFEDPELPREMVREVAGKPGALPLLSFTAARLWELRDRHFRQLTRKAYQGMGGVGGALAQHAEATLARLPGDQQRRVRELFRHLVSGEGTRAVLTRAELEQLLGGAGEVIDRLIDARLLQASEGEGGRQRVEVVHEALLAAWPRLVEWRREDGEGARLRDQLRAAARQWHERGRPRGLLWRDEALAELQVWRARAPRSLTDTEESFAAASALDAARGRRLRRRLLGATIAVLAIGVAALTVTTRQAKARLVDLFEEQGRQELLAGDPLRALVHLSAAYSSGRGDPALRLLLARATRSLDAQLATLDGHRGPVVWLEVSPDGARILTASSDHTAKLWDAASGRLLATLDGHTKPLQGATFSPDGTRIATASRDRTIRLWDGDGRPIAVLRGHTSEVASAIFGGDGRQLVSRSFDGAVRLWSARDGAAGPILSHGGMVTMARLSPDGRRVLTTGADGTARTWDAASGAELARVRHRGPVTGGYFSPDGALVVTHDAVAKLWDPATGAVAHELEGHWSSIGRAVFSPDGRTLSTAGSDGTARLWDVATGRPGAVLTGHRGAVVSAEFNRDGTRVVTAGKDGAARLWDARTGVLEAALFGHTAELATARFSRDGTRVFTASHDGTARIWDARPLDRDAVLAAFPSDVELALYSDDGARVLALSPGEREARSWDSRTAAPLPPFQVPAERHPIAWSSDGKRLVTGKGALVEVWPTAGGAPLALAGHRDEVVAASFSRDGRSLITASADATARVWDLGTGALRAELAGHEEQVGACALSADGALAATGSVDATARIWSVAGARLLRVLPHRNDVQAVALSPDGLRLATGAADHTGSVFRLSDGAPLATLEGHSGRIYGIAWSEDGALVATAGADGTVRVWDGAAGRELAILNGHSTEAYAVAFSPDGAHLVSGGLDGTVRIWPIGPEARSPAEVERLARCRAPYRLVGSDLLAVAPPPCDR